MVTVWYSSMHFLVDFICAWAMFSFFSSGADGYARILVYNFCAFALQMPLGTVLDSVRKRERTAMLWSFAGAGLTVLGAVLHPAVLGLGNALFHVGGGVDVIREDFARNRKGADLGVFVAPGAVGLYLGNLAAGANRGYGILLTAAILLALLSVLLVTKAGVTPRKAPVRNRGKGIAPLLLCCFAVVVLRSWAGMGISFPWKGELGLISVLAVAAGKALGGFAAAKFGMAWAAAVSLAGAALCFLYADHPVFGILALLLFNMTMPMTLYLLAEHLPHLPGFSFGLLTFGLFLGFLPVYAELALPLPGGQFGFLISLVSAFLLIFGLKAVKADVLS